MHAGRVPAFSKLASDSANPKSSAHGLKASEDERGPGGDGLSEVDVSGHLPGADGLSELAVSGHHRVDTEAVSCQHGTASRPAEDAGPAGTPGPRGPGSVGGRLDRGL